MSYVRFTPIALGLSAVSIPGSGNLSGKIIPWRANYPNFDQVVISFRNISGVPNILPRISWFDWDGVTEVNANQGIYTAAFTSASNLYLAGTGFDTPKSITGTVAGTTVPIILGAPFVKFRLDNIDGTAAVWTVEVLLLNES